MWQLLEEDIVETPDLVPRAGKISVMIIQVLDLFLMKMPRSSFGSISQK